MKPPRSKLGIVKMEFRREYCLGVEYLIRCDKEFKLERKEDLPFGNLH
jgi:hypothetical protein